MSALTTADMIPAFRALESIAETHPELPYATFHVRGTTLAAEQVIDVQLNKGDADAFAVWVAAFNMTDDQLTTRPYSTGFGFHTTAVARYGGVTWVICLTHIDEAWRPAPEAAMAA